MGIDINPGMLAVARAAAPGLTIKWQEANAEALPLPDDAFEVAFCQIGLMFFPEKKTALEEMRRVLVVGGRVLINLPGPMPPIFAVLEDALGRYLSAEAAGFMRAVFSLHDAGEIRELMSSAGLQEIEARSSVKTLHLPDPPSFLWQYVHSTPLAAAVAQLDEDGRAALQSEVLAGWQPYTDEGAFVLPLKGTVATARK